MSFLKSSAFVLLLLLSHNLFASASEHYEKALMEFEQEDFESAYIHLKNALQQNDGHLPSKLLMGRIMLINGYLDEAIDEFEEILAGGADKNLVLSYLSQVYLIKAEYDKLHALSKQPGVNRTVKLDLILNSATAYIREQQREDAIALYEQAIPSYPKNIRLLNSLASLYIYQRQYNKAEQTLDRSLQVNADNPTTLHTQGLLYKARGEHQQAFELFQRALAEQPEHPTFMRSIASALAEAGKYNESLEMIEKIAKQTPGDMQNLLLKANLLALTNKAEEAKALLTELNQKSSLVTEDEKLSRKQLNFVTGILAYLNQDYAATSADLGRYVAVHEVSPDLLSILVDSLSKSDLRKQAIRQLELELETVESSLALSRFLCELYIVSKRSFKCDALLKKVEPHFRGDYQIPLLRIKIQSSLGKYQQALDMIAEQFADTDIAEVTEVKIIVLGILKRFQPALELAKKLSQDHPQNVSYANIYADLLLRQGNAQAARKLIDTALEKWPDSKMLIITSARIDYSLGNKDRSLETLEALFKTDKDNIPALLLTSQIYAEKGNVERAIEHLLFAQATDAHNEAVLELLAKYYAQQGDYQKAYREAETLLTIGMVEPNDYMRKAELLLALAKFKEAKAYAQVLYERWQTNPTLLMQLAPVQEQAGDGLGATKSYQQAIALQPDNPYNKLMYGKYLVRQQQYDQAQQLLADLSKNRPTDPNVVLLQGELAQAKGQHKRAFSHFKQAHSLDNDYQLALIKLYQTASDHGFESAFTEYMLKTKPAAGLGLHLLADIEYKQGNHKQAQQHYHKLLGSDYTANRASIYNNMANIALKKSDYQQAHDFADKALKITPNAAAIVDTKGWIHTLSGKPQEGLGVLRRAFTLNSEMPVIRYHLAYTLNQLGRKGEARLELQQALASLDDFKEKADAQALLDSL